MCFSTCFVSVALFVSICDSFSFRLVSVYSSFMNLCGGFGYFVVILCLFVLSRVSVVVLRLYEILLSSFLSLCCLFQ